MILTEFYWYGIISKWKLGPGLIKNTHTTNGYGLKVQGGDDVKV